MKQGKMVIFTRQELINSLTEFYTNILKDSAGEVIREGNTIVPAIVLENGVEELDNESLVSCADTLGNYIYDVDASIDAIMLFDNNH